MAQRAIGTARPARQDVLGPIRRRAAESPHRTETIDTLETTLEELGPPTGSVPTAQSTKARDGSATQGQLLQRHDRPAVCSGR